MWTSVRLRSEAAVWRCCCAGNMLQHVRVHVIQAAKKCGQTATAHNKHTLVLGLKRRQLNQPTGSTQPPPKTRVQDTCSTVHRLGHNSSKPQT